MKTDYAITNGFVEGWLAELGRAIEMFSGQGVTLRHVRVENISVPSSESALWLKQVFKGAAGFETWLGAQEETWTKLGGIVEADSSEAARSTYLEIVNQAQLGAATVASSGLDKPIECEEPETFAAAGFELSKFVLFDVELGETGLPALSLAIEISAELILDPGFSVDATETAPAKSPAAHLPSIYASVLELNLPVSVSVGHVELEIKKVLQAGPGSVIALNKEVNDFAELLVHGKVVARGEIVLAKGNYGFRVKEIASQQDRFTLCDS